MGEVNAKATIKWWSYGKVDVIIGPGISYRLDVDTIMGTIQRARQLVKDYYRRTKGVAIKHVGITNIGKFRPGSPDRIKEFNRRKKEMRPVSV